MSILIRGMEMPKNCAVCRLEKDLFGRAVCFGYEDGRALHKDDLPPVGNEERRPSWCPLVAIPTHGDLIDRDALMKDGWLSLHKEVMRMGGYAIHELPLINPIIPVIIEAEVDK